MSGIGCSYLVFSKRRIGQTAVYLAAAEKQEFSAGQKFIQQNKSGRRV